MDLKLDISQYFIFSHIYEFLKSFFFQDGQVNLVEESQTKPKLKKCSEANLFLVPFDHYNLSDTMQLSMLKKLDDDIPPVFMILDTFEKEVRSILPGTVVFIRKATKPHLQDCIFLQKIKTIP